MKQPLAAHMAAPHPGDAAHVHAAGHTPKRSRGQRRHAKANKHSRLGRTVAMALTAVLSMAGAGAATATMQLTGNIDSVITDDRLVTVVRPEVVVVGEASDPQPLNILVLGTDGRDNAANRDLGGGNDASKRSDTALIMHIGADRRHVSMVSIPRDSIVDIPACPTTTPGLYTTPHYNTRFNAAFAFGYNAGRDTGSGALCAMYTVEKLTNVRMDGFIAVDFNGFRNMVDALGGVEMCIPQPIHAPLAGGLRLDAGRQTLNGWQALQFARARTGRGLGDGSDLGRIARQQELLAAIALDVLGRNLLTDAPALLQFLGATTSSMTMSDNLASLTGLTGLAGSLQHIRPSNVEFITVPNKLNPANPNTVVWLPEAELIWDSLRYSEPISEPEVVEADLEAAPAADPNGENIVGNNGAAPAANGEASAVEAPIAPGASGIVAEGAPTTNGTSDAAGSAPAAPAPNTTDATDSADAAVQAPAPARPVLPTSRPTPLICY